MGCGIAVICLMELGIDIVVKDIDQKMLDQCTKYVRKQLSTRLGNDRAITLMKRLVTSLDYKELSDVDIVIEAASENLKVKQMIFKDVVKVVRKDAMLATNTSSINIDLIGDCIPDERHRLIGLHYFNPPVVMKLLEIIRTTSTSDKTIANAVTFAKGHAKVPIVVGNCVGFTANRLFFPYFSIATWLVGEMNLHPYKLDAAVMKFGIPIGPFALNDLTGGIIFLPLIFISFHFFFFKWTLL